MTSAALLQQARRRAGLTQAQLAERVGTTQSAIARWERGASRPTVERLQSLVEACGLELQLGLVAPSREATASLRRNLTLTVDERVERMMHPRRILDVLSRRRVDYVMIGGLAAAVHGSDPVTAGLDITPATTSANLRRLSNALDDLDARVRTREAPQGIPFVHDPGALARQTEWQLTTSGGHLDLAMLPSGTRGYDDLRRDAIAIEILGVPTRVAALADIIRSKEAAGSEKDRAVLPMLRRLQIEIDRVTHAGRGREGG